MKKSMKNLSKALCALVLVGILSGCSSNNTGSDQTIVKFNQGTINQQQLFDEMIKNSGMNTVIEIADKAILDEIIPVTEEMQTSADSQIEQVKNYYGDSYLEVLKSSGFDSEEEYTNIVLLNLQRENYLYKYIGENVLTDEEIQKYYDEFEANISASHILISPKDDTDEADKEALNTAKDLIARLDKGEDFAALAIEYSDDPGSGANGGDLGSFGKGMMVPEFESAAYALNVNEYTKEPVKSSFGYHIILKTGEEKKETLEEMRDDIVKSLAVDVINKDESIANKALVEMRKDNGFTITNDVLNEQYEIYTQNIESNTQSSDQK